MIKYGTIEIDEEYVDSIPKSLTTTLFPYNLETTLSPFLPDNPH